MKTNLILFKVLSSLYERLILVDVPCIESILEDEKLRYWNIAKQFYELESDAVKASKAAYMISLVCNF